MKSENYLSALISTIKTLSIDFYFINRGTWAFVLYVMRIVFFGVPRYKIENE